MITTHDDPRIKRNPKGEGATLEDAEIKRRILNGEISTADMTVAQREKYREEIKRARRY